MNPHSPGEKFRYLRKVIAANRRLEREGITRIDRRVTRTHERPIPDHLRHQDEPMFLRRQAM